MIKQKSTTFWGSAFLFNYHEINRRYYWLKVEITEYIEYLDQLRK